MLMIVLIAKSEVIGEYIQEERHRGEMVKINVTTTKIIITTDVVKP
jgi:hypothetical protein